MGLSGKAHEWVFIGPSECKVAIIGSPTPFCMFPHTPYSTRKGYLNKLGATIHLIGNKLEIGVPLDKGHRMTMLMSEDKAPRQSKSVSLE